MRDSNVLERPQRVTPALTASEEKLMELDAATFRANFPKTPFLVGHRLAEHPLLKLPSLIELSRRLPASNIEYNAGNIAVNQERHLTPHTGLSIEETIRRIEDCYSWMVLKYVEQDSAYHELLLHCLGEIQEHSEVVTPGMCRPEAFIFVSSPGSVTPYHMDPEYNFLLQIRGTKTVHLFDPDDAELVMEQDFERYFAGAAHRNMVFKDEFQQRARTFTLTPGLGLFFPVTAPHWVKNGDAVSISFSVTYRTPGLERRTLIHNTNAYLRSWGLKPSPFGRSRFRDGLKYNVARMWRRLRGLVGKT